MRIISLLATLFLLGCSKIQGFEDCTQYAKLATADAIITEDWRIQTLEKMGLYFVLRRVECSMVMKKRRNEKGFIPPS